MVTPTDIFRNLAPASFRFLQNVLKPLGKIFKPVHAHSVSIDEYENEKYGEEDYEKESYSSAESPLRAELLSADQMGLHARRLASAHEISSERATDQLLTRLTANEIVLTNVCNQLAENVSRQSIPAAEWLLDNFYLIEEQINTAKRHFPKGYSRALPRLANGPSAGLPRVYDIALEAIAHGDGRVDLEIINRFVMSYQSVTALSLGELWAIPIMLRLALIENLRRVAARIQAGREHRRLASSWAKQMLEVAERDPKSLILVISDMARSRPPMVSAFVAELARRLQGHIPVSALPLTWIEQLLSESNLTIEKLVRLEAQQQAADQVSIGNSIGSLRFLGATDWREFVEATSVVEAILAQDCTYKAMTFSTRDDYRHAVEKIARASACSENEVANHAIQLALSVAHNGAARFAHVGFYLIDAGRSQLERVAGMQPSKMVATARFSKKHALPIFLGALAAITLTLSGLLLWRVIDEGFRNGSLALLAVLIVVLGSRVAVMAVNFFAVLLTRTRALPRMDFSAGIPVTARTLVVVPTLLSHAEVIDELCEALEVRFLANRDEHTHFALLTGFLDATTETCADDAALLQAIIDAVNALNAKYERTDLFFLLHRARVWNPQERLWMGYERKRGKLADLNALLRHGAHRRFAQIVGDIAILPSIKYVITLDTDTQLPRDSAQQLVGAMAHPLNRPLFADEEKTGSGYHRINAGYAIMQPLVATSVGGANASRYAHLFGNEAGIDPYTRAVADVYQNVFSEGSFVGKGIYDVDAVERALADRIPENRILSHDLLEGCIARAGLLSDSQLHEGYPAQYCADVRRRQRWIRGDWQLLGWLLPRVRGGTDNTDAEKKCYAEIGTTPRQRYQRNPLTALSRWKILDNLLRSLNTTALTALLLFGWLVSAAPIFWMLVVLGAMLLPSLGASILHVFRKSPDMLWRQHLATVVHIAGKRCAQALFELMCLPFDAYYSLDAILRTLARLLFTRRRLLQWDASNVIERNRCNDLSDTWRSMAIAPLLAIATAMGISVLTPATLLLAAPILLLWFCAPVMAWWVSRQLPPAIPRLNAEQLTFLRKSARRTWAFFEEFVGPDDHWLPPDNFQIYRSAVIAHRTSPTNMGMALLANLTAYDFGYIPQGALLERTDNTLATMALLERYQGHFYNWYDTQTLQGLNPIYISSVDSGNLAGHLLVLRQGLLALLDQPPLAANWRTGIRDTAAIVLDMSTGNEQASARMQAMLTALNEKANDDAQRENKLSLTRVQHCIESLLMHANEFTENIADDVDSDLAWWSRALLRQCHALNDELQHSAPWLRVPVAPAEYTMLMAHIDSLFSSVTAVDMAGNATAVPTLRTLTTIETLLLPLIEKEIVAAETALAITWLRTLYSAIVEAGENARERVASIENLSAQIHAMAQMQYNFLYDKSRRLLAIGYNVSERRRDNSYYDLLASEARMANFIAIAQRQLPQESWFSLGRLIAHNGGKSVLLSWSGSMFEYLMPLLVMPTYANTLLDQTNIAAVARQIEYGKLRGVPWGVSESGYNAVDVQLNYQYHAFGVPGLGLKRGLAEDLVIAPYASVLALMVAPEAACANLQRLAALGVQGRFGFYEAVDYTPSRQRRGEARSIVHSFMAHHQGMSLLALAFLLLGRPMQRRFEADLMLQATLLLLQERIPKATAERARATELADPRKLTSYPEMPVRIFATAHTPSPEVQLLSNGRYHVMVTNAGSGYSRWRDLAVTRWREDSTCDNWGSFCYLRDMSNGEFWSVAHQPTLRKPDNYQVIFSEGRVEFRRSDNKFDTHTEIVVSPEDDIELRRMHITNTARTRRIIEVTSYAEVVIAAAAADALHPAFSNLFVQTEIVPPHNALLCTRRPRFEHEATPSMLHLLAVHGADALDISYETDRREFIGRGNTPIDPAAMYTQDLSGAVGSVLDPIVAIRCRVLLEPDQCVTIDVVSGIGADREAALRLIAKYQDRHLADRVFDLAWTHSQVLLRQLNATEADAQLYGRLASSIIYANAALRADASVLINNQRGQSGLWAYAISGDLPIVLLQVQDTNSIELVRQLVQAHAYWRLKGLAVDLVIWNQDHAGYRQQLQDQIIGLIGSGTEAHVIDRPGGIFVRPADQIPNEDRVLLLSVARVVISDSRGTLEEQLNHRALNDVRVPRLIPKLPLLRIPARDTIVAERDTDPLLLDNGLGGFSADGAEYVITLSAQQTTPAPWANVLANPHFGTLISESGRAYTWSENAHEYRLTPWYNDAVSDSSGEALYIRDEESGQWWSPTPLPVRGADIYRCRHGFGYSVFEHSENGIFSELTIFVALDAAVKFSVLKIRNDSTSERKLSATGFVEWVLGDLRPKTAQHIATEIEPNSSAVCARNPYNSEFPHSVAFFDVDDMPRTISGDRREFLGRNGTQANPAALLRQRLSGKVGAGLDPCAAIQVPFELAPGEEREIIFRLGVATDIAKVEKLIQKFRGATIAHAELASVKKFWRHTLDAVQIDTPDIALNMLTNGWLMYQVIASRMWARSGYYQSGGAFGFRDQLQDAMALIHTAPVRLREQLLLCASRQFVEGDVQHWWHPPTGRGVRTRCSDDLLWLPLATCRYVCSTGDTGVLNETAPFLSGRAVNEGEESYYDLPGRADEVASLYQHCVRAIQRGLRFGVHGLPLIGAGDWNDGMNLVGIEGKGESVWLGFFLCDVLTQFSDVATLHGDIGFADFCREQNQQLRSNIEVNGWDGAWYRRAYFDDGTALGSAKNDECQIDSISQSWSVLSNATAANSTGTVSASATQRQRSRLAMDAVYQRLVRRDDALIQLLDPPFNRSNLNPGYIKGYVPGVRENGGQYTHGAIWAAMAFAALGEGERSWELLRMINPVMHGLSAAAIATYKVEPYVMAADVYAVAPHTGRGGWSWYTGSAGWMYRLIIESLLGLRLDVDKLHFAPCVPVQWPGFNMLYRFRETIYAIKFHNNVEAITGVQVWLDGVACREATIVLRDDSQPHCVVVNIGVRSEKIIEASAD